MRLTTAFLRRDRECVGPGGGSGPGQRPWPAGVGGAGVQGFCYRVMLGPRWWLWTSATTLACGRWQSRRRRRSLAAAMRAWWRASGYALFLHQTCPTKPKTALLPNNVLCRPVGNNKAGFVNAHPLLQREPGDMHPGKTPPFITRLCHFSCFGSPPERGNASSGVDMCGQAPGKWLHACGQQARAHGW